MIANAGFPSMREALELAAKGFAIFPIFRHTADGRCACLNGAQCGSPGKHPAVKDWGARAASQAVLVRRMWSRAVRPGNIGCVPRGCLVLDFDPRNGGTAQSLERTLPDTLTALSGRSDGGFHAWYRMPPGTQLDHSGPLAEGVDVKAGSRGYVVMPPSLHAATMAPYTWGGRPEMAEAPLWLVEAVQGAYLANAGVQVSPERRIAYAYIKDGLNTALDVAATFTGQFHLALLKRFLPSVTVPPMTGDDGHLENLAARLCVARHDIRYDGRCIRMRCPVHNGESGNSLSFAQGEHGIVAHCFGCRVKLNDIADALHLPRHTFYYRAGAGVLEQVAEMIELCKRDEAPAQL